MPRPFHLGGRSHSLARGTEIKLEPEDVVIMKQTGIARIVIGAAA